MIKIKSRFKKITKENVLEMVNELGAYMMAISNTIKVKIIKIKYIFFISSGVARATGYLIIKSNNLLRNHGDMMNLIDQNTFLEEKRN